ncbi:MAG: peptidase M61 [Bacteroidetes bacterium]|nr:peptidase M61 [Bacteroidota bacterium]
MLKRIFLIILCGLSSITALADKDYHYLINLNKVVDDKITIELTPPNMSENEVVFNFPAMVPGTYEVYNFGRFVSNLKAFGKNGSVITVQKLNDDSYKLSPASQIQKITYEVEDSWDTKIKEKVVFEPGGSNIEDNKNFVFNTHCFFGYFTGYKQANFVLEFEKPKGFYPSTGLSDLTLGEFRDVIKVSDYNSLVDSPIMYNLPDTATIMVANTKVLVSVYSPNGVVSSKYVARDLKRLLYAQRDYLNGELPVDKYAFLIYLSDKPTLSGSSGALEHSYSSFYVLPEVDTASIAQTLNDVCAHEFFHIVTPLNIHAEEIGDFDFNNPKMSEHLWLYEGLTEYSAHHAQVLAGLIGYDYFFQVMMDKYNNSIEQYNDTVPFTFMSKHVLTEHYHKQYNNVYEKGALINMCLDIMLRYYSDGKYGTQELMRDLAKKYGKDKSFKDPDLFNDIEKLTFPEIRKFLDEHVAGRKPLPMVEVFKMVGLDLIKERETETITLGGFGIGYNDSTKRLIVIDVNEVDEFGKQFKYKVGDELYSFNNRLLTLDNAREVVGDFMSTTAVGDKLVIEVYRKDKKGKYKLKKLSGKVKKVKIIEKNIIDVSKNPTEKQITARRTWLGIE